MNTATVGLLIFMAIAFVALAAYVWLDSGHDKDD